MHTFVINLAKRTDRWQSMVRSLNEHSDWLTYSRIDASFDPDAPWKGCYRSHLQWLENYETHTNDPFLVLEDDVELSLVTRALLIDNHTLSTLPPRWDILLLSCTGANVRRRVSNCVFDIDRFCGTYAMVINGKDSARRIYNAASSVPTQPIDDELSMLAEKNKIDVYLMHPFVATLLDSASDISGPNSFEGYARAIQTMDMILTDGFGKR